MALTEEQQKRVAYIEKKAKSLEEQIEKLDQFLETSSVDPINAKLRLDSLSTLYPNYVKYNDELSSLQFDHPRLDAFDDIQTLYFHVATAVTKLQKFKSAAPAPQASSSLNAISFTLNERQELPKLPEIDVPIFSGNPDEWIEWKAGFVAVVHSWTDIGDYVKHTHLQKALKGGATAIKIVSNPASNENYSKAWIALCDGYDHKSLIAAEHLDAILDFPFVGRTNSKQLSALIDKSRQHLSMLAEIGINVNEDTVIRIMERCLPQGVYSRWQDKLQGNKLSTLNEFYTFVQDNVFKLRALERAAPSGRYNAKKRPADKANPVQNKISKFNARPLVTNSSDLSSKAYRKYREAHALYKSSAFHSIKHHERWNFIMNNCICRNCLSSHSHPCNSSNRCKVKEKGKDKECGQNHQTLLHPGNNNRKLKQSKGSIEVRNSSSSSS